MADIWQRGGSEVEAWDGAAAWRAHRGGDGDLGMGPRPGTLIRAATVALDGATAWHARRGGGGGLGMGSWPSLAADVPSRARRGAGLACTARRRGASTMRRRQQAWM